MDIKPNTVHCIVNNLHTLSSQAKVSNVQIVLESYKCTITLSKDSNPESDQLCVEIILQTVGNKDNIHKLPDSLKANIVIEIVTTYTDKNLKEKHRTEYDKLSKNNGQDVYKWKLSNLHKFPETSCIDTSHISVHVRLEDIYSQPLNLISETTSLYPNPSDTYDIRIRVIEDENENENEEKEDAQTVSKSRMFYCHKYLLTDISDWFKDMLLSRSDSTGDLKITIRGVHPDIFEKLFTFMYTSRYDAKSVYEASQVIKASTRFQFGSIRHQAFQYLRSNINNETLWIIWDLSVSYGCEQAVCACEDYARKECRTLLSVYGWQDLDQESITKMICVGGLPISITKTLLHTTLLAWRSSTLNRIMSESSKANSSSSAGSDKAGCNTQRYFKELQRYPKSEEEVEKVFFEITQLICSSEISIHRVRKQTKRVTRATIPPSSRKLVFKPMYFNNSGPKKHCKSRDS
ncbi:hypothetical protein PHYBLDRAFT_152168 [Phycomyces blakesleeanus NRRL 1555(-)]|uniref:BTB domain-containing protein n=1 Tax=Phycomyces blakesleeanus (strain ATCC 8743b / DSM 1359 / FGSC 10004 / NBRC 33097 / NRRL 1555) TaxID=763407 RepID=A0A162TF31_PHYB8|nr:hypothetical protein PHYBLDRAFT_152168 [Phycomyces blakesleeanus NRRL 1555(-)]OAD66623.1 hypothetical protein PHYBLDRAFT_152168 [Phycomyces blakesleeanus NRRL 1555(-)]|eukprot:XP_018284663.1 hypothetical protein PHYBLDRAFT_152168 [Phycomyces blakesleeanus NRRL 1555(-)]